jgi:hypothetical protein
MLPVEVFGASKPRSWRAVAAAAICSVAACGSSNETDAQDYPEVSCDEFASQLDQECPDDPRNEGSLRSCKNAETVYVPAGCGHAFHTFLGCAAQSAIDCDTGKPRGCDRLLSSYSACLSNFVRRTGCTRLEGQDESCPANTYSFGCMSEVPSNCQLLSSGEYLAVCCSDFDN